MASLKDLRNRIASVKSTQKITSAMKMVAAAKLRRAQEQRKPPGPTPSAWTGCWARWRPACRAGPAFRPCWREPGRRRPSAGCGHVRPRAVRRLQHGGRAPDAPDGRRTDRCRQDGQDRLRRPQGRDLLRRDWADAIVGAYNRYRPAQAGLRGRRRDRREDNGDVRGRRIRRLHDGLQPVSNRSSASSSPPSSSFPSRRRKAGRRAIPTAAPEPRRRSTL